LLAKQPLVVNVANARITVNRQLEKLGISELAFLDDLPIG